MLTDDDHFVYDNSLKKNQLMKNPTVHYQFFQRTQKAIIHIKPGLNLTYISGFNFFNIDIAESGCVSKIRSSIFN